MDRSDKRTWDQIPTAERVAMIEDVAQRRRMFSSLCGIAGLTMKTLSTFISDYNTRQRRHGKDSRLIPGLVELKRVAAECGSIDTEELIDEPQFIDKGNTAELVGTFSHPNRAQLDDLLRTLRVDMKDWIVERIQPNTWQTMTAKRGEPEIITLYQMKAWLRRKTPAHSEWPLIKPVTLSPDFTSLVQAARAKQGKGIKKGDEFSLKRCLVIPDSQNGYARNMRTGTLQEFHDRRAWDLSCQVAERMQPDLIVLLGDHCDLPDWSDKFVRSPEVYFTTQPMLLELAWWLSRLRALCPNAEIVFIEGNHEARMPRAVMTNNIAAFGLQSVDDFRKGSVPSMSIQTLLGLDNLGIKYKGPYPQGEVWINDNLRVEHANVARAKSVDTARAILENSRSSVIFGHIHRREVASKNVYRQGGMVTYMAECPGCICHIDGRVPAKDTKNHWNQGLLEAWYEPGNGYFRTSHIPINEGTAIYDGMLLTGETHVSKITKECDWNFGTE